MFLNYFWILQMREIIVIRFIQMDAAYLEGMQIPRNLIKVLL